MEEIGVQLSLVMLIGLGGGVCAVRGAGRSASDVLADLEPNGPGPRTAQALRIRTDTLGKVGLLTAGDRRRFLLIGRLFPWIGALSGVLLVAVLGTGAGSNSPAAALAGFSIGYLAQRGRLRRRGERYRRSIEFYLPIVMERLVMAVQSGLDIPAAIAVIVELNEEGRELDPVTGLLCAVRELAERGVGFDAALRKIAAATDCSALRHAFVHLAVAYREGGELIAPLKELSDATQLYFQESTDEQIAKLPVKATAPLLCAFTGLILCFITSPIIQLMQMAGKTARGLQ